MKLDTRVSRNIKIRVTDTIEFMTQHFYKTTIEDTIKELKHIKYQFITKLQNIFKKYNIYKDYGEINISKENHGFAMFLTNLNNTAIFNNMTYHFNFTLPTLLNEKCEILDMSTFRIVHCKAIRILQFMSPLLISKYGSSDILSKSDSNIFSKGSQRVAVSRYIGVGTYDTYLMNDGKQLVSKYGDLDISKIDYFWFNKYHNCSAYVTQKSIGFDFNYNKYKNHGIEFRIFEYFSEELLRELLEFFVYLFDHIYTMESIENPIYNELWNKLMVNIMKHGKDYILKNDEKQLYELLLNIKIDNQNSLLCLNEIMFKIKEKYINIGICSKLMIQNNS